MRKILMRTLKRGLSRKEQTEIAARNGDKSRGGIAGLLLLLSSYDNTGFTIKRYEPVVS